MFGSAQLEDRQSAFALGGIEQVQSETEVSAIVVRLKTGSVDTDSARIGVPVQTNVMPLLFVHRIKRSATARLLAAMPALEKAVKGSIIRKVAC